MRITIPFFSGQVSVVATQRLEDNQATLAQNCWLDSGDLRPIRAPLLSNDTGSSASADAYTLYRYSSSRWVRWDLQVSAQRSPSEDLSYGRLYWTGNGYPKVTDNSLVGSSGAPSQSRRIGLPVPNSFNAPTTSQEGIGTVSSIDIWGHTSSANQFNAMVHCTANHGLHKGDYVALNFPGIDAIGYEVDLHDNNPAIFRIKGLRLRKLKFGSITAPKKNGQVIVKSSGHGLDTGDIVAFYYSGTGKSWLTNNAQYMIDVIDGNQFYLSDLDGNPIAPNASTTADDILHNRATQALVRVSRIGNPGVINNIAWVGNKYFVVNTLPDGDTNEWTQSDVASALRDRSYVVTYVNGYGEEGPPSDPSGIVTVTPGTTCSLSGLPTTSLSGANDYWITAIRIYRTDETGSFRFLTELSYGTTTYSDTTLDKDLGETLATTGWYAPSDDLQGLISLPGGIMVGYFNKTISASMPYLPYAYPIEYQFKTDGIIKGLAGTAAGLVVLTDTVPHLITGTSPDNWAMVKLESQHACVSTRSVVDMGAFAIYAAPDGLIGIQGAEVTVLTKGIFSRKQWQALNPDTIIGCFHEDRYFGSYKVSSSGNARKSFMFNPVSGDWVSYDQDFRALFNYRNDDTLYGLTADGKIYAWDRDNSNNLTYTWVSKTFQAPFPSNFGAAQVVADGPVTLSLTADGAVVHTQTVSNSDPIRLPGGYRALNYQLSLSGSSAVSVAAVANSVGELRDV